MDFSWTFTLMDFSWTFTLMDFRRLPFFFDGLITYYNPVKKFLPLLLQGKNSYDSVDVLVQGT